MLEDWNGFLQEMRLTTVLRRASWTDINGVMEHLLSVNAMLQNAKDFNLSLVMTFRPQKCIWSNSYSLVMGVLSYIKVPSPVTSYIANMYSKLLTFYQHQAMVTNGTT